MRVQHNIMAMNAYRNYNNNTKSLSGNLEKLSSGYKINRAGDDAAGLAISEKMRAQITGLNAAQKNVKDGISLVKTAEGAMQEIQDMLNRMDYLATQSANGTYQDEVDRENLNKEVTALKTEINRIADSSNFNGIKLLDGSLAGTGGGASTSAVAAPKAAGFSFTTTAGSAAAGTLTFGDASSVGLGGFSVSANVNGKTYTLNLQVKATSGGTKLGLFDGDKMIGASGGKISTLGLVSTSTAFKIKKTDIADAISKKISADLGNVADVSAASGVITITAKQTGANTITIDGGSISYMKNDGVTKGVVAATAAMTTEGKDKLYTVSATDFTKTTKASAIAENTYTLNGVKFAFMTDAKEINKVTDSSINIIQVAPSSANAAKIAAQLNQLTGLDMSAKVADGTITFRTKAEGSSNVSGGGLRLQIGDTADGFNQMMVAVGDMHTKALGIDGIDISTQDGAASAIQTVKDAINTVSSVRGDLGAIQNRLDHTINNLSVMAENIQDAESTIRDTDVAEEMMSYVKNNILVQSAQAMLAQANQVPQGVLQLLG